MSSSPSVAANLSNDARKGLTILSLSKAEPIAHLADREGVSRQFLYRQKQKAVEALDEAICFCEIREFLCYDLLNIDAQLLQIGNDCFLVG